MNTRIRIRIFLPVLILIIAFPILNWLIFSATSGWYMEHTARQDLDKLMGQVRSEAARVYAESPNRSAQGNGLEASEPESLEKEEAQSYAKQLLEQVKTAVKQEQQGAQLLVLNTKLKLVYPGEEKKSGAGTAIYEQCKLMLDDHGFPSEKTMYLEVDGSKYLVDLFELKSAYNVRAQYFIGYAHIQDGAKLLSYAGKLIFMITAVLLLLSVLAVWVTAGSIAKPLTSR